MARGMQRPSDWYACNLGRSTSTLPTVVSPTSSHRSKPILVDRVSAIDQGALVIDPDGVR